MELKVPGTIKLDLCGRANGYLLKEGGDGYSMFMDNEFLFSEGMQDYQVLTTYMTEILNGRIDERYAKTEGRNIR